MKRRTNTRTATFKIDYPPTKAGKSAWNKRFGLNAYYSGKPWQVRKRDAEYWHTLTRKSVRESIAKPQMFENPVVIEMYFNDNLDASNHAAMAKMCEDGLKGLLIEDDNRKHVKGIAMYFHSENFIKVIIRECRVQNTDTDVCIGYTYPIDTLSHRQNAQNTPSEMYGIYKNVILATPELESLQKDYPNDWEQKINRLSAYIKQTGKKYNSHYAVIAEWAKEDAAKNHGSASSFDTSTFYSAALAKTYGSEGNT